MDNSEPVRYLLKHQADPHFSLDDSRIETFDPINGAIKGFITHPIHKGNVQRCTDIIDTLLEHNMDIHRIDPGKWDQWNHVHHAIANKAYDLLPYLLSKDIDPNARTLYMGHTSMTMLLTAKTKEELCGAMRYLLNAKADPHIKNNDDKTILDYIPAAWHPDVQALIDNKKM
jgi:ankyrin repeat protein